MRRPPLARSSSPWIISRARWRQTIFLHSSSPNYSLRKFLLLARSSTLRASYSCRVSDMDLELAREWILIPLDGLTRRAMSPWRRISRQRPQTSSARLNCQSEPKVKSMRIVCTPDVCCVYWAPGYSSSGLFSGLHEHDAAEGRHRWTS